MAYDRKVLYKNSKAPVWAIVLGTVFLLGTTVSIYLGKITGIIFDGAAFLACLAAIVAWYKNSKANQKEYKAKVKEISEETILDQINSHCLLSKVKDDTAFFITDDYLILAGSFIVKTKDVAWFYVIPEGAANTIHVADKKGRFYSGKTALLSLKAEIEPKVRAALPHILIGYSKDLERQYEKKYR